MAQKPLSKTFLRGVWKQYKAVGYNAELLAEQLGRSTTTVHHWIKRARDRLKLAVPQDVAHKARTARGGVKVSEGDIKAAMAALDAAGGHWVKAARKLGLAKSTLEKRIEIAGRLYGYQRPAKALDPERLRALLRQPHGVSLAEAAVRLGVAESVAEAAIRTLQEQGFNIHGIGGRYAIEPEPAPQHALGELPAYTSRPDHTFVFGFTSDNHLCSKYERLDVLNDLYDRFAAAGVDRVFNAGNWIDGEARFNKFELKIHGMDRQLAYLAEHYPQRRGITTYAIAGDDHEGWYCQREGVDIGAYAEMKMRQAGRTDWVNLGYIEAFVRLVNRKTGREAKLLNCHPGGGSAYAISYTSQKSIEAFEGGEKPAVALFGHYHKMMYVCLRNVHVIQTGCTEDQTTFMRKKKLSAMVGGGIARLRQDPASGAIVGCQVEFFNYFNQGYYNDRWSMSGDAVLPERKAA